MALHPPPTSTFGCTDSKTCRFWNQILSGSEDGNESDQILRKCIQEAIDAEATCQIHAEVKVLGYLQSHGLKSKAINSVGINKLCCPACLEYINASSIPIQVRGTHNKWYPWHLSLHGQYYFPLDQLQRMKQSVLLFFKADWSMHLLDQRLRSHSFGNHSDSSGDDAVSETMRNVPVTDFVPDKLLQGDYNKKFVG